MVELGDAVKQTNAWACYDCGKCTATCPIARVGDNYSPRRHVLASNRGQREELVDSASLFHCLTCGMCDSRCPAKVEYTELILRLREMAHGTGAEPECPHGGALQSVMRMMAQGGPQQNRLEWLNGDLKTDPKQGEIFFWTGCTMYYDALFPDYGVKTLDGTKAAIKLMNKLGVTPVVSPEERCCGHDLLWNGDRENFEKLAKHNIELVERSGAWTVVTSCAECLRTWKLDYLPFYGDKAPRVLHLTEFLAEHAGELEYDSTRNGEAIKATFHDPCRLGRHLGIYDPPREALKAVPGVEMVEMAHSGKRATCCAGGTWSNCDRFAKKIQVGRLKEARATGAEVMVTACPKCQVHFRCTMQDKSIQNDVQIELRDVAELVAEGLA